MYVSVTRTKGASERQSELATMAGEAMLRWLRDIDGFDGLLMITNEAAGATLTLTFWKDKDVAERHRAARMRFRDSITAAVNVKVEETVGYDVSFVHLGQRLAALQR